MLVQSREEFDRKLKNTNKNTEDENSVILKLDQAKSPAIHLEPLAGIKNNKEKGEPIGCNYFVFGSHVRYSLRVSLNSGRD